MVNILEVCICMENKILVTYATRTGSTVDVAVEIGREMRKLGSTVHIMPMDEVKDITGYDAVVIGSPIRVGKWLPEAVRFVKKHSDELRRVHTALFTVCMTLFEDTPENRDLVNSYIEPLYEYVKPVAVGAFAGAVKPDNMNVLERFVMRMVKAPVGDFRDWEAIHTWATDVYWLM